MKIENVDWQSDHVLVNGNVRCFEDGHGIKIPNEEAQEAFKFALAALKHRLEHCAATLKVKAEEKTTCFNSWGAFWQGGHFSMPVYTSIKEFLASNPKSWGDVKESLIGQQIVRALDVYEHSTNRDNAFNIATELLLCL